MLWWLKINDLNQSIFSTPDDKLFTKDNVLLISEEERMIDLTFLYPNWNHLLCPGVSIGKLDGSHVHANLMFQRNYSSFDNQVVIDTDWTTEFHSICFDYNLLGHTGIGLACQSCKIKMSLE